MGIRACDLKIGVKIYANFDEFDGKSSMPYVVVEKYDDHIIGYNPNAQMSAWLDFDSVLTMSPAFKCVLYDFEYGSKEKILDSYKKYYREKFDRDLEEER